jgi:hypothetical protein
MTILRPLALALALCAACSGPARVPDDPQQAFAALEQRLLEAPAVLSVSHLTAEGAFSADLRSEHVVTRSGTGRIRAVGSFAGQRVDLTLAFDGERMLLSGSAGPREFPQPSDVQGGLLLGLTRMGWLHNVAMLVAGQPPDATDGSVREFTRAVRVLGGEPLELDGRVRRALTFGVEVRGEPAATAALWLDLETGLPLERWQKVSFPEGEMRVVETYEVFSLAPDLAALGL